VHLSADEKGKGWHAPWGPTVTSFERQLTGLIVPATRGLRIEEIASLAPYDAAQTVPTPPGRGRPA
jgi:hypothetical protein